MTLRGIALALIALVALALPASAQTSPNWTTGQVPTTAQWNSLWASKQDYLGAPPLLTTGGTMTGKLITDTPGTAAAGFNLPAGVAPTTPIDGDMWTTTADLFVRINGVTLNLTTTGALTSVLGSLPIEVNTVGLTATVSCATCVNAASTATVGQIPRSTGTGSAATWSTATYPATTTVNRLLYSSSANVIADLATANNGVLITSAGGVPSISSTLPNAVQDTITRLGTITVGVWTGTDIALADGGTNASLTASNGGVVYSTASAMAILSGTATASLPLLSGSTAAPTWATVAYPTSATSGGVAYFSSTTVMASSAALGSGQCVFGGGAGSPPTTSANCSISSGALTLGQAGSTLGTLTLSGNTSGTVILRTAAAAGSWTFQLPANDGTSSQVLSTDGAGVTSWVDAAGGGTVTSVAAGTGMSFTTITATGSVAIDKATAAQLAAGTSNKVLTTDIAVTGAAYTALTPGATVTPDLNVAFNFTLTANQNFTLANPSNITGKEGRSFCIVVTNDSTPRTITFGTQYYAPGGDSLIALTASASAVDQLCFLVVTTTRIHVTITKNYLNT